MLEPAHDDTAKGIILLCLLVERLGTTYRAVEALLIFEAIYVLRAMRVDVLQALGEFIVEAVDEADNTSANEDSVVLLCVRRSFHKFIVVFGYLLNSILRIMNQGTDEQIDLLLRRGPHFHRHIRGDRGVVIETRRDKS